MSFGIRVDHFGIIVDHGTSKGTKRENVEACTKVKRHIVQKAHIMAKDSLNRAGQADFVCFLWFL